MRERKKGKFEWMKEKEYGSYQNSSAAGKRREKRGKKWRKIGRVRSNCKEYVNTYYMPTNWKAERSLGMCLKAILRGRST